MKSATVPELGFPKEVGVVKLGILQTTSIPQNEQYHLNRSPQAIAQKPTQIHFRPHQLREVPA